MEDGKYVHWLHICIMVVLIVSLAQSELASLETARFPQICWCVHGPAGSIDLHHGSFRSTSSPLHAHKQQRLGTRRLHADPATRSFTAQLAFV